jgi:hypothetical protein
MSTNRINPIKIFAQIALIFFLYLLSYYFYVGITNPIPAPGDSTSYHLPISKSILNGTFINPSDFPRTRLFAQLNPGSSEVFDTLWMFLHVPLTISNLFASIVLFFCCFFLARKFKLEYYFAIFFATTICTLTVISRWFNAISIDVWMAIWFSLSIILLEKPEKTWRFFLFLGITFGMLVGSKYSGWPFIFVLLLVYGKVIFRKINILRFLIFLIPFSMLGLFWYVRNYLAVDNPMWPICLLWFPCTHIYETIPQMWNTTLLYPVDMFNAFFGEYKLWCLSLLLPFLVLYARFKRKDSLPHGVILLCFIGFTNFLFLSVAPTDHHPWIMVSSFRYSYPMFIPLILSIFLLASHYKKEIWIGYFALANMLPVLTMSYYPKLVLFYLPFAFLCFYILKRYESTQKKELLAHNNTNVPSIKRNRNVKKRLR